ncbi:MAG: Rpn family recombination-promoting nuclease/putative transposase [Isosphaeraceae bacterium]
MSDFDNPWKDVLEYFFRDFLAFFFPEAHAAIDWNRNYESLDKELQQIVSESELGLRLADKLFKVWLADGREAWILVHVEIQNQRDPEFAERMFVYNYRIYDRHRKPVISLAVMGDEDQTWRPNRFAYGMFGCTMAIQFPVVKLVDYVSRDEQLETTPNPFAAVVLAHLKTQETRTDPGRRRAWKFGLVKSLYDRGLDGEQVRLLFRFLDAIMVLPRELEKALSVDLAELEKERTMPYVTSIERIAREEARSEAKVEALLRFLTKRFKTSVPAELEASIRSTNDLAKLDAWIDTSAEAGDLAEFRRICGL